MGKFIEKKIKKHDEHVKYDQSKVIHLFKLHIFQIHGPSIPRSTLLKVHRPPLHPVYQRNANSEEPSKFWTVKEKRKTRRVDSYPKNSLI